MVCRVGNKVKIIGVCFFFFGKQSSERNEKCCLLCQEGGHTTVRPDSCVFVVFFFEPFSVIGKDIST